MSDKLSTQLTNFVCITTSFWYCSEWSRQKSAWWSFRA